MIYDVAFIFTAGKQDQRFFSGGAVMLRFRYVSFLLPRVCVRQVIKSFFCRVFIFDLVRDYCAFIFSLFFGFWNFY